MVWHVVSYSVTRGFLSSLSIICTYVSICMFSHTHNMHMYVTCDLSWYGRWLLIDIQFYFRWLLIDIQFYFRWLLIDIQFYFSVRRLCGQKYVLWWTHWCKHMYRDVGCCKRLVKHHSRYANVWDVWCCKRLVKHHSRYANVWDVWCCKRLVKHHSRYANVWDIFISSSNLLNAIDDYERQL